MAKSYTCLWRGNRGMGESASNDPIVESEMQLRIYHPDPKSATSVVRVVDDGGSSSGNGSGNGNADGSNGSGSSGRKPNRPRGPGFGLTTLDAYAKYDPVDFAEILRDIGGFGRYN